MKKVLALIVSLVLVLAVAFPASAISSVALKSISVGQEKITLLVGNSYKLNVKFDPAKTTQRQLTFVTDNKKVAVVDKNGKITAVGKGSTVISVISAADNKIMTKCAVTTEKKNVTLKMWGGVPAESGPQAACDNFNKLFGDQGTKIEYERFVNDTNGNLKLDINLMGGSDIDLYMTYSQMNLTKRASGRLALQLDSLMQRDDYSIVDQYGELTKSFIIDGRNYCVPTVKSQVGYLLNKDMFDAAGIAIPKSWTMDEFRTIAKKLTKGDGANKVYGTYINTNQFHAQPFLTFFTATVGNDPFFMPGGKESRFADPLLVKAYQTVVDMMNVDKSMPTHVDAVTQKLAPESMFLSGKAAMISGTYLVRNVKDRDNFPHKFVTAFAPYPTVEAGKYYCAGSCGDFMCINPRSTKIEEAWQFIKWYGSEGMAPLAAGGRIPLNKNFEPKKVLEQIVTGYTDLIDSSSCEEVMIKPLENYAVNTILRGTPMMQKLIDDESEAIYMGKDSVKDGLQKIKVSADAIINNK